MMRRYLGQDRYTVEGRSVSPTMTASPPMATTCSTTLKPRPRPAPPWRCRTARRKVRSRCAWPGNDTSNTSATVANRCATPSAEAACTSFRSSATWWWRSLPSKTFTSGSSPCPRPRAQLRPVGGKPGSTSPCRPPRKGKMKRRAGGQVTANRVLTYLKAALNHAYDEGKVESRATWDRKLKPFKGVNTARLRYLEIEEAQRLLNASDPEFRPLVRAACGNWCPLRRSHPAHRQRLRCISNQFTFALFEDQVTSRSTST